MQASSSNQHGLGRDILGLACTFLACFLLLGIVTYHPHDPSFTQVVSPGTPVHNGAGLAGAYAAGLFVDLFGVAAYVFPAIFLVLALKNFIHRLRFPWWRWVGVGLFTLVVAAISSTFLAGFSLGRISGGGFLGESLSVWTGYVLGPWGARILAGLGLLASIQLLAGDIWSQLFSPLRSWLDDALSKHHERAKRKERLKKLLQSMEESGEEPTQEEIDIRLAELESEEDANGADDIVPYPNTAEAYENEGHAAQAHAPWDGGFDAVKAMGKDDDEPVELVHETHEPVPDLEPAVSLAHSEDGESDEFDENDPIMALERLRTRVRQETDAQTADPREQPAAPDDKQPVSKSRQPAGEGRDVVTEGQIDPEADLVRESRLSHRKLKKLSLPPKDLLASVEGETKSTPPEELKRQAQALHTTLQDFGVQGEVTAVRPGPVVTLFEFKPAPGVKISKIANLSDDLALALKAMAIRIEAPIPGKDTVGVEIPSKHRQTVHYRDILESGAYNKSESLLTLALGKDIEGQPCVADLAKMPHLLVAGATGTG
ncbi:MAG: DNA translocase FtsK 4TM domain-containing protein, partial [Oceanidesulfovibrio sp.]